MALGDVRSLPEPTVADHAFKYDAEARRHVLGVRVLLVALVLSLAVTAGAPAASGAGGVATEDCESGPAPGQAPGFETSMRDDGSRTDRSNDRHVAPRDRSNATPSLTAIHPSPTTTGDDGETVIVRFPEPTDGSDWRLVDDAGHEARLPNRTLAGSVALSPEPAAAESAQANRSVAPLTGRLRLADDGDGLALSGPNDTVVDRVTYDGARDGRDLVRTADGWQWRHPSATDFDSVVTRPDVATAFALPDAPAVVLDALASAERRLLLGGYTLTSDRVVDALIDAHEAGVRVAVLLDGSPVGGTSRAQVDALDRLEEAGVSVTVLAGSPRTYATHHPKYAVVDDRALVLTENWKPAGVGGRSSRGWGVLVRDEQLATSLASVFRADASGSGARSWAEHRPSVDPVEALPATGEFPSHVQPASVPVQRARLLLAPDNAEAELTDLIRSADDSVLLQQVRVSGPDDPLLSAVLAAARDGATVRVLLSTATYVATENRELAEWLRARAEEEELSLTVDLVEPGGAFEKSHVKGVIVDDCQVVLGSLNWNPTALRENREVLVVLEGESVAAYYSDVFALDRGAVRARPTPVGLLAAVGLAWLALATIVATRVRWHRL